MISVNELEELRVRLAEAESENEELRALLAEVMNERDALREKLAEFEHTYGVTEAIEDWFERGFY